MQNLQEPHPVYLPDTVQVLKDDVCRVVQTRPISSQVQRAVKPDGTKWNMHSAQVEAHEFGDSHGIQPSSRAEIRACQSKGLPELSNDLPPPPSTASISSASSACSLKKNISEPPYHVFSRSKKKQLVYIVSLAGLFSPLSSNIYFPALGQISRVCSSCFQRAPSS